MTRDEKNELLVKFACARLAGRSALHVNEDAVRDVWSVADAMLAEYLKRQPARPVAPAIPQPTPEERAEGFIEDSLDAATHQGVTDLFSPVLLHSFHISRVP